MKPRVRVKTSKGKGPALAKFRIGLELEFDPLDVAQSRAAAEKLFAVLQQFGSPEEVEEIRSELQQQLSQAAGSVS